MLLYLAGFRAMPCSYKNPFWDKLIFIIRDDVSNIIIIYKIMIEFDKLVRFAKLVYFCETKLWPIVKGHKDGDK